MGDHEEHKGVKVSLDHTDPRPELLMIPYAVIPVHVQQVQHLLHT